MDEVPNIFDLARAHATTESRRSRFYFSFFRLPGTVSSVAEPRQKMRSGKPDFLITRAERIGKFQKIQTPYPERRGIFPRSRDPGPDIAAKVAGATSLLLRVVLIRHNVYGGRS